MSESREAPMPRILRERLAVQNGLDSSSHPLEPLTRGVMDYALGHDFSRVRIHSDAKAAESASQVDALAYTVGTDIVFGAGQYSPETPAGELLVAHELAHVMQTGGKPEGVFRWWTRAALPHTYVFNRETRTVTSGLGHEDITRHVLSNPEFTTRPFPYSRAARETIIAWSANLDVVKERMRTRMLAGSITREAFDIWERYNHAFTEEAGLHQRRMYIEWAVRLANVENNMEEALHKVGDALHVAQDRNAHRFIPPGCSPWRPGCSEAQDDPGINRDGFDRAFFDTWNVLQDFYEALWPQKRTALSNFGRGGASREHVGHNF